MSTRFLEPCSKWMIELGRHTKIRGKHTTQVTYDVFVLAELPGSKKKIWWRQTGPENRWGNIGFTKDKADALVKRLIDLGVPRSDIKVTPHKR